MSNICIYVNQHLNAIYTHCLNTTCSPSHHSSTYHRNFQLLIILAKSSFLDVSLRSEYTSVSFHRFFTLKFSLLNQSHIIQTAKMNYIWHMIIHLYLSLLRQRPDKKSVKVRVSVKKTFNFLSPIRYKKTWNI